MGIPADGQNFEQDNLAGAHEQPRLEQEQQALAARKRLHLDSVHDAPRQAVSRQGLEKKHGIEVLERNGKYEYRIQRNKESVLLLTTDASKAGLLEADRKLEHLAKVKQQQLYTNFKIIVAKDNENAENRHIKQPDGTIKDGPMVKCRNPRLAELYGLEEAFEKSKPSHMTADGKNGIKVYFLRENIYEPPDNRLADFSDEDKHGRARIYIYPELDGNTAGYSQADASRRNARVPYSFEATIIHELGHNSQFKRGWSSAETGPIWAHQLGWVPYTSADKKESGYLIQARDGSLYKSHPDDGSKWIQCNNAGEPLDHNGHRVDKVEDANQIDSDTMRNRALIRPVTEYFTNPLEECAEGIMFYRMGKGYREQLWRESPALYKAVKKIDTEEIVGAYGKDESEQAKFIRSPEGYVVPNTPANRKRVEQFEEDMLKVPTNLVADDGNSSEPTAVRPRTSAAGVLPELTLV